MTWTAHEVGAVAAVADGNPPADDDDFADGAEAHPPRKHGGT